jgi:hypothetical protein
MKCIVTSALLSATAIVGICQTSQAQVTVISSDQAAKNKLQVPVVAADTILPTAFRAYLRKLQTDGNASKATIASAVQVANDLKTKKLPANAFIASYAVPPLSNVMRLPDAYPADGEAQGTTNVILAQDQHESGSFNLYSFVDHKQVQLAVSDLKSADGTVFPAANIDLKVVKVWYQNGNGWFSYFSDPGLQLVPELLVYDENLVRVDTEKKANYARVKTPSGTKEVWITSPHKVYIGFDHFQDGFADAESLAPVSLTAGQFKQFFLNVHAPTGTKPGIYKGNITVTAQGQPTTQVPIAVKVLPYALPQPKTNYDVNKDFYVSLMGSWPPISPDHKAFMPSLRNMRKHNLLNIELLAKPTTDPAVAEKMVKGFKEAGFRTDVIFGGTGIWVGKHNQTQLTYDDLTKVRRSTREWGNFYKKHFGHTNAFLIHGDEQGAAWASSRRPYWRVVNLEGLKTQVAGHHSSYFAKAGYMINNRPLAGTPADGKMARDWQSIGNGYTGFYANQHNGSENPDFVRRQHGLMGYLNNFDMVYNYEFGWGHWNDNRLEPYKPMVLAYPSSTGLVDTLAWEGFRQGIDDIRYATKLRQLANEAVQSGNIDRVYEGRKVYQWLTMLDSNTMDLARVRLEMIQKIENLMKLSEAKK